MRSLRQIVNHLFLRHEAKEAVKAACPYVKGLKLGAINKEDGRNSTVPYYSIPFTGIGVGGNDVEGKLRIPVAKHTSAAVRVEARHPCLHHRHH